MSGLAALLAGRHDPGVYRWHAAFDVEDVRASVERAGALLGHVDGWRNPTKTDTLDAFAAALAFPEWFGRNLDAFADCLADVLEPTVVLWDGWGVFARGDAPAFAAVLEVLQDRAGTGAVPFSVLLRGDGPEPDVRSLDS
ncbi:barstar family protein [Marmoricola sp. RAF53]|uniref:barstar family protein n=1 Tax=Marmoricola sp. RAF53 TaxID=3233059 RepID=UPI003F9E17CE